MINIQQNRLLELSNRFETPLYVYDADIIRNRYRELIGKIPYTRLKLFYAMKANFNPAILRLLEKEGANIDAVSPGDVHLALRCGFSKERILFTANKITDEEMHEVHSLGVLFNIGSLLRLEKYGATYPGSNICLRFNPGIEAGENVKVQTGGEASKFGISMRKVEEAKRIVEKHNLKVIGLHEHTGSGIPEAVQMMLGMKKLITLVDRKIFPDLEFVDFGGGFKAPYLPDEQRIDYSEFGNETTKLMEEVSQNYGKELNLYFEPGKFLVAESGVLLVKVTTLKNAGGKKIVGVNSGFPQLIRPMFYGAYHHILNLSNIDGEKQVYDVVGNICESGDCFAVDRELSEVREGDILAILNAGAYCYSMGSVYNLRPMPAEVMVDGDDFNGGNIKIVSKGLSSKELVDSIFRSEIN